MCKSMPIILLFITIAILVALTLVGLRLLHTGYSEKSTPELALAAFFLLGGAATFGFDLVAREFLVDSPEWQAGFRTASNLASRVPAPAIALFTWKVFRPTERWAAQLFMLIVGVQLGLNVHQLWTGGHPAPIGGPVFWVGVGTTVVALGWAMADSFSYYRTSVRRLTLGLTTPIVTDRFLLWAVFSGTAMLILIGKVTTVLVFAADAPFTPARSAITAFQSVVGLTCITTLTLTFYPPAAYRRWVEGRASGQVAAS